MNQRKRKLMMMHKALHPRDDVNRLYMSTKKKGGRGLTNIVDSVNESIPRLEDYKKARTKTDYSNQKLYRQNKHQQNKNNQKTKIERMYGRFKQQTSEISDEKTWT